MTGPLKPDHFVTQSYTCQFQLALSGLSACTTLGLTNADFPAALGRFSCESQRRAERIDGRNRQASPTRNRRQNGYSAAPKIPQIAPANLDRPGGGGLHGPGFAAISRATGCFICHGRSCSSHGRISVTRANVDDPKASETWSSSKTCLKPIRTIHASFRFCGQPMYGKKDRQLRSEVGLELLWSIALSSARHR